MDSEQGHDIMLVANNGGNAKKTLYMCFIDYAKTSDDRVKRDLFSKIMSKPGVTGQK